MRIVYGTVFSPYVRKVLITLQLKNIPYDFQELHPLFPAQKQKLLQLSPLGKVPIYQEDNFILPDSSAICAYLDKQYKQPAIFPTESRQYPRSLWLEEYADVELTPTIIAIFINTFTKPKMNIPIDNQALTNALEIKLPAIFDYLNHEIEGHHYFNGDQLSIADISILSALMNYKLLDLAIDESRWHHLARYSHEGFKEPVIKQSFIEFSNKVQEKYGVKLDN